MNFIKDKKIESICLFIMYIIVGYMFQHNWPFPYFVVFVPCFCLIGIAAIYFISYFSVKMQIVTSSIANQRAAENLSANVAGKYQLSYVLHGPQRNDLRSPANPGGNGGSSGSSHPRTGGPVGPAAFAS